MKTSNSSGVALVQVLIMTAIMSLIAIQFSQTARNQVSIASDFSDRLDAELLLRSARSQVYFNFFKYDSNQLSDKSVDGKKWNLRNEPFQLNANTNVKIQATSGLISVLTAPDELFEKVIVHLGVENGHARSIVSSINDWVDVDDSTRNLGAERSYYISQQMLGPRNGPLQHISELKFIKGIDPEIYRKISPFLTIYTSSSFNPSLAPQPLIEALFDKDRAVQILNEQQNQNFDEKTWRGIVGSEEIEYMDIHPKSTFMLTISVSVNDVHLTKHYDLLVQSQKTRDPIITLAKY